MTLRPSRLSGLPVALLLLAAMSALGCDRSTPVGPTATAPPSPAQPPTPARPTVTLVFPYGSEKKPWLTDVTDAFNAAQNQTPDGKVIRVELHPMGSGEAMEEVASGRLKAHLVSPASGAFIELANAESRTATGKDLVGPTQNLVLSPVVIAMWKPMAEALGWPAKPVGWSDVLKLSAGGASWADYGFPQWGRFKFGHTHPQFSNSGLISILAEVYAAAGKQRDLSLADVNDAKTAEFVQGIERSVVHYGSSTGFFGRKMFDRGPEFLSAAVMYENMVIESYGLPGAAKSPDLPFPVVALYPKEGTFWSDHPIGVVQREWVDDEHRAAAKVYTDYLLAAEQQRAAMKYGFRPGDPAIAPAGPIDAAHGVDPAEPRTTLAVPPADVMNAVIDLWKRNKKHANIALVLDTSGSMKGARIDNAKAGAEQLVQMLGAGDRLSVVPFNTGVTWALTDAPVASQKPAADAAINSLFAGGDTALYDAVAAAYDHQANADLDGSAITAVVVLTDGEDTASRLQVGPLLQRIRTSEESRGAGKTVRVFTIGYGGEANAKVLKDIADATDGKAYAGTPENIREVFKDIATFF